jgi:PTH1 family peptidyl-tRNA hydrolase
MSPPVIIVGLGNPGSRYDHTPHNLGFEVLDFFAAARGIRFRRAFGLPARVCSWQSDGPRIRLIKPTTFMNRSGVAVKKALKRWKCGPENLLVVFDDVELPLGQLRLKARGGGGGHNGMASIIQELDNRTDFARLRLGAGPRPPGDQLIDYLLNPWASELNDAVECLRQSGSEALAAILEQGVEASMNHLNRRGAVPAATQPQGTEL